MKRREFVKTMAVGAAASASGCAGLGLGSIIPGSEMSMAAMDQFLGRFDSGLLAISENSMFDEMAAAIGKERAESRRAELDHAEELGKRAMRTLYAVGMFRDLPEEARLHPGVQERMWRAVPEMAQSIRETTDFLDNLSEKKRARLKQTLAERPDSILRLGETLDRRAADAGIPLKRRLHLRHMLHEVGGRFRHSPALAIDEYVGKVRKVEAWAGSEAEVRRRLVARHGKDYLWQLERRSEELRRQWQAKGNKGPGDYDDRPAAAHETPIAPLGIFVEAAPDGVRVSLVSRGSGGMKVGDVVVAFGNIDVQSPTHLVHHHHRRNDRRWPHRTN